MTITLYAGDRAAPSCVAVFWLPEETQWELNPEVRTALFHLRKQYGIVHVGVDGCASNLQDG